MKHRLLLDEPTDTTCKYQHRKDLPHFIVSEARSEHAGEFAAFTGPVSLSERKSIRRVHYSERFDWDRGQFDAITNALARYPYEPEQGRSWVFIQTYAGGIDGRRNLVHGCLARRYLDQCGTWTSSYRIILSLVDEMRRPAMFSGEDLCIEGGEDEAAIEAQWDVFFTRLTGLQEYGWHAGVEELMWASDSLNGGLSELDWEAVVTELQTACPRWSEAIIDHARANDAFFTQQAEHSESP